MVDFALLYVMTSFEQLAPSRDAGHQGADWCSPEDPSCVSVSSPTNPPGWDRGRPGPNLA